MIGQIDPDHVEIVKGMLKDGRVTVAEVQRRLHLNYHRAKIALEVSEYELRPPSFFRPPTLAEVHDIWPCTDSECRWCKR